MPLIEPQLNYANVAKFTGGGVFVVATVAALKALNNHPAIVFLEGYAAAGDGGGGTVYYDATSSATADNGLVFTPDNVSGDGRYLRLIDGENASCKFWGVGLSPNITNGQGTVDDTAQLILALTNSSRVIDISKSIVPVLNGTVPVTALCPGIMSDGSGILCFAPTALTNQIGLTIEKSQFYVDRINAKAPISLTASQPVGGRLFNFRNDSITAQNWRVTNCYFEGGRTAVTINSQCNGIYYCDNLHYQVWSDAVQCIQGLGMHMDRNIFYDCGYDTGSGAGVIRNSSSFQTAPLQQSTMNDNVFISCYPNSAQEAIDLSSAGAFDLQVNGNVIYDQQSGVELKTFTVSAPFTNDLFQTINISNNVIRLRGTVAGGTGINLHQSSPNPPANKSGQHKISGNLITTGAPVSAQLGVYGVYVEGYDYVDVSDNTIFNVSLGIYLSGSTAVAGISTGHTVRDNRVRATSSALTGAISLANTKIKGNVFRTVSLSSSSCINLSNVVSLTDLVIEDNSIIAELNNTGINLAFAQSGTRVINNDIKSATSTGMATSADPGGITDLWIEGNKVNSLLDGFGIGVHGTGITILNNTVTCPSSRRVWTAGASATVTAGNNSRGTTAAAPVIAGSLGDVVYNHTLGGASAQAWMYVCTVANVSAAATWRPVNTT